MPYKTIIVFTYLPIYKHIHSFANIVCVYVLYIYIYICIYSVFSSPVAQKTTINQLTINDMKMRVVGERNQ